MNTKLCAIVQCAALYTRLFIHSNVIWSHTKKVTRTIQWAECHAPEVKWRHKQVADEEERILLWHSNHMLQTIVEKQVWLFTRKYEYVSYHVLRMVTKHATKAIIKN